MLLALLLVTRAAAEWVEISQQHYRKPVRITTALDAPRNNYPDVQNPQSYEDQAHIDQVFQTPVRDSFLQNMQNPLRKYQEHDMQDWTKSNYAKHGVSIQQPIRKHFHNRSEPDTKPAQLNPSLQEDMSAQSPVRNTKIDQVNIPIRNTHSNKNIGTTMEDTYLNRSITEYNWDQNIQREPAKFVTTESSFDRWNVKTPKPNERNDKPDEIRKLKIDNNVPNTPKVKDETVSGKIERVPNIGSVKRVQLENTHVKSPALNNNKPKNDNRRNNQHGYGAHNYGSFSDELDLETSIFNSHVDSDTKKPSNHFKQEPSRTEEINLEDNSKGPIRSFQRHPFTHEVSKGHQGNGNFKQNGDVSKNADTAGYKNVNNVPNKDPAELLEEVTAIEDVLPNPVTNNEKNMKRKEVEPNMETGENRKMYRGSVKMDKTDSAEEEFSSEKEENINKSSSEIKVNTIENILKFIKVVADTISKNTRRGKNKITYLNELKQTLMANIKDRIDAAWPDDETSTGARRHSRSASAAARGHVEFPSSESALMTISFLTFAVFLIKLVLQVIQTYKHKAMAMAPLMLATAGRAATKRLREN